MSRSHVGLTPVKQSCVTNTVLSALGEILNFQHLDKKNRQ